jgi:hypothetical protein
MNSASLQQQSKGHVSNKFMGKDISISESKGIGHSMYAFELICYSMINIYDCYSFHTMESVS